MKQWLVELVRVPLCKEKATVELLGGKLEIELKEGHIFMTGPATTVFEGKIKV